MIWQACEDVGHLQATEARMGRVVGHLEQVGQNLTAWLVVLLTSLELHFVLMSAVP